MFNIRPIALATLTATFLAGSVLPTAADADKVIVKVNGQAITHSQVKLAESEIGPELQTVPEANRLRVVVEYLIENQLMADAAAKEKLESKPSFNDRLAYYKRRALRDAYFEKSVKSEVTEATAKKMYDTQIGNAKPQQEVRARHILVKTEAEAKDVVELINRGDDFAKLAAEKSTGPSKTRGGDLGYFRRGQMVPAFDKAVWSMKKGDVSEPVKTRFGWHVIKLEDKRSQPLPSFASLKDRIMASLLHRQAQKVMKGLRSSAKIEMVDAEYKKQVENAPRGSSQ